MVDRRIRKRIELCILGEGVLLIGDGGLIFRKMICFEERQGREGHRNNRIAADVETILKRSVRGGGIRRV